MQEPRNPVVDFGELASKLLPVLFGQNTSENSQGQVDPAALLRSNQLFDSLLSRSNDSALSDKVVSDILYRAQLAFAPVLGEEKTAGVYNSTTKDLMAKEAVARATAASADAVFKMQQQSLEAASQIAQTQLKASAGSKTTKQQAPQLGNLIKSAGVGVGVGEAVKGIKSILKGTGLSKNAASNAEVDANFDKDVNDYFAELENSDSGAFGSAGGAGDFGGASEATASFSPAGAGMINADDPAALQNLIDSTTIPTVSGGQQVADAGITTTDVTAPTVTSFSTSSISPDSVQTLGGPGSIAVQKAAEANGYLINPANGLPYSMPVAGTRAAAPLMPPADPGLLPDGGDLFLNETGPGGDFTVDGSAAAADSSSSALSVGVPYATIAQGTVNTLENPELNATSSMLGGPVGITDNLNSIDDVGNVVASTLDTVGNTVGNIADKASETISDAADSVICTESLRQGLISQELLLRELRVNVNIRKISRQTVLGYHYLAIPLVKKMRRNKLFAMKMAHYAELYCKQVTGELITLEGWVIKNIGEPICWLVGFLVTPDVKEELYGTSTNH